MSTIFLSPDPRRSLLRSDVSYKKIMKLTGMLGLEDDEKPVGKILGRQISVKSWGLQIQGDNRLAKGFLEEFETKSRQVETPGAKEDSESTGDYMNPAEAARFRRGAAKLNYMAQDRADLAFASKEVSRHMAKPEKGDMKKLLRVIGYLRQFPSWVCSYPWQEPPRDLVVFTDSDWGGCSRTRRSTSGRAAMHGGHVLVNWSRTQQLVALSSAEAELNASAKAAQEGLSLRNLCTELGDEIGLILMGDPSANDGILKRTGAGKVNHFSVRQLWLQEKVGEGDLCHVKIPRAVNVADAMTHYTTRTEVAVHFAGMNCFRLTPFERSTHPDDG